MRAFSIVTFGCQMNQHDSERAGEVLRRAGLRPAASVDHADVILVNTCSVREKAEQKLRSEIGRLGRAKRARPDLVLGLLGCVAQQRGQALLRSMPQLDLVLGPDNIAELPELLGEIDRGGLPRVRTGFDLAEPRFLPADPESGRASPTAYVTIMKGCDERCSFCIVPTTRGPERYRPSSEVIFEIRRLVDAGVREVTLLGQTVNSYRDPQGALPKEGSGADGPRSRLRPGEGETQFPALLRAIADRVPGLSRLRYTSPHPRHLTPALVRAHAELEILPRHVHMPVQSGSDRMLKRMIRRYGAEEYVERVEMLRGAVPGLTLSTDVIVGFPGETRRDFELTLELVRRVGFVGLFGFKYSPRPHTAALNLADDVPESEKSSRLAELFALSEELRREHLRSLVGTTQSVLIEGRSRTGTFTGRTERNEIVHVDSQEDPTGQLRRVKIVQAFKNSLLGRMANASAPPGARAGAGGRRALRVV